jgi:glycerol-3-phosphate dehydrogenase (NAD(P)+)
MNKNIVIIGAGEIGSSIGNLLKKKNHFVEWWDADASKVPGQKQRADSIPSADVLFLCIPSWAHRPALAGCVPYLSKKTIVLTVSKGLEKDTKKTIAEVLQESLPHGQPHGLLSGPMLAEEIDAEQFGCGVYATSYTETYPYIAELFGGTVLRIEYSMDIAGIAYAGVLKNVYALALGVVDGLSLGDNARGWMITQAMREASEILHRLGGMSETAQSSAFLGDLVATGSSGFSCNREEGEKMARTGICNEKSEGCISLPSVVSLLGDTEDFPLLQTLDSIFMHHKDVRINMRNLLKK